MWYKYCLIIIILPLFFISCPEQKPGGNEKEIIIIKTDQLPDGLVNSYYNSLLTATGGEEESFTWSLVSGSLPDGMNLSGDGIISGIPVLKGTYQCVIQVTDNMNNPGIREFFLFISELKISPYALIQARENEEYYEKLEVTGGTGPYSFSQISGEFPENLVLNEETGEISGIASDQLGTYSVSISIMDSHGSHAEKDYTLNVINGDPIIITDTELPSGIKFMEYLYVPQVTGGTGVYSWELFGGELPPGLIFNSVNPNLSGIPQAAGFFSFIIQVKDPQNSNNYHTKELFMRIFDQVRFINESCDPGIIYLLYSFQFAAVGGSGAYDWEITGGEIPPGLEFDNQSGILNGIPTETGDYSFTIEVNDTFYPENAHSLIFNCPVYGPIEMIPETLSSIKANKHFSEALHAQGGSESYKWSIIEGALPLDVEISEDDGIISGYPSHPGIYSFTVKCEDTVNFLNYDIQSFTLEVENLDWTIMVYLDGDNNLETYAFIDFNELEGTDLRGTSIKVIVLIDGIDQYYDGLDNFTDTRLYEIKYDEYGILLNTGIKSRRLTSDELGITSTHSTELNMADVSTLSNFITYTKNTFTAENYGLILWDHGDGWPSFIEARQEESRSIISDFSSNNDKLAIKEVGDTIRGRGISYIGFDACLMGMMEVAYELKDCCEVMTGSEGLEPGDGWEYHLLLNSFKAMTERTPRTLGAAAMDSYTYHYSWDNATLSTIDLTKINDLKISLNSFIIGLESSSFSNIYNKVAKGSDLQRYYSDYNTSEGRYMMSHIDLWDFTERLNSVPGAIECISILQDTILYNYKKGDEVGNSHGLSIYFPMYNYALTPSETEYRNADLFFIDNTRWDEYIYHFWRGDDVNEPNDNFMTATTIQKGNTLNGYIQFYSTAEAPPDADFFSFTATSTKSVYIFLDLHGNSFLDLVLELYTESNQTTPVRIADTGGYGATEQITYYAMAGNKYFIKVYEKDKYAFDRTQNYSLSLD